MVTEQAEIFFMWKKSESKQLVLSEMLYILWHSKYLTKVKLSRGARKEIQYSDESMSDFPLIMAKEECHEKHDYSGSSKRLIIVYIGSQSGFFQRALCRKLAKQVATTGKLIP
jgi:hypothetical protein